MPSISDAKKPVFLCQTGIEQYVHADKKVWLAGSDSKKKGRGIEVGLVIGTKNVLIVGNNKKAIASLGTIIATIDGNFKIYHFLELTKLKTLVHWTLFSSTNKKISSYLVQHKTYVNPFTKGPVIYTNLFLCKKK